MDESVESFDLKIRQTAPIEKEGWAYLWKRYEPPTWPDYRERLENGDCEL